MKQIIRTFSLHSRRSFLLAGCGVLGTIYAYAGNSHLDHDSLSAHGAETLLGFFRKLFRADFMPHGHCYWWRPEIVLLHVISDFLIGLSYFSIPAMVVYYVKKRKDVPFHWMFHLFAGFIFWCGITHFISIVTLWIPVYRLDGLAKAITAAISVATAFYLFPLIPQALSLKSARQYEKKNAELEAEVRRREAAEDEVRRANLELEQRVRQRTKALESSNRELEEFAYVASHDLKEPLRMVLLYAAMLAKLYEGKLEGDGAKYLDFMTEGTKRMQRLIDAILTYAQVGKENLRHLPINTNQVLQQTLQNIKVQLEQKRAKVEVDSLPELYGDEIELGQLFQNLISNAVKYNHSETPTVWVSAKSVEGETVFSIQDNGIGIVKEFSEKIFKIFQRLHTREQYVGTGIGLAICKKIVDRNGGRIWVESTPGKGSTFYFTLPLASRSTREFEP